MSWEKVELGRLLFYDTRLSGNQTYACASCHQQSLAFTDGIGRAIGSTDELHPRGSMSLANVAYTPTLTWANPLLGRLEDQALVPMFGEEPIELGLAGKEEELLDRLQADPRYQRMFAEAFSDEEEPINLYNILRGLGSFQRTLISGNSPFDRYVFGFDDDAISESAIRGAELFLSERFECFHCHGGILFTNSIDHEGRIAAERPFHNNALYNIDGEGAYPADNIGLLEFTLRPADMGRFKPPTLRNVAVPAPYMHDGSMVTLEEIIDHYAAGGRTISEGPFAGDGSASPLRSIFVPGFKITEDEKQDVINFLESLTDQEFLSNPQFADPFAAATCPGDCNYDGQLFVSETITGINIALATAPLAECIVADTNDDGAVRINELITVLNRVLAGCT